MANAYKSWLEAQRHTSKEQTILQLFGRPLHNGSPRGLSVWRSTANNENHSRANCPQDAIQAQIEICCLTLNYLHYVTHKCNTQIWNTQFHCNPRSNARSKPWKRFSGLTTDSQRTIQLTNARCNKNYDFLNDESGTTTQKPANISDFYAVSHVVRHINTQNGIWYMIHLSR